MDKYIFGAIVILATGIGLFIHGVYDQIDKRQQEQTFHIDLERKAAEIAKSQQSLPRQPSTMLIPTPIICEKITLNKPVLQHKVQHKIHRYYKAPHINRPLNVTHGE